MEFQCRWMKVNLSTALTEDRPLLKAKENTEDYESNNRIKHDDKDSTLCHRSSLESISGKKYSHEREQFAFGKTVLDSHIVTHITNHFL